VGDLHRTLELLACLREQPAEVGVVARAEVGEDEAVRPGLLGDASGLAGFEAVNWYGWLAPAATPLAIVQKLNAEIGSVVRQPEVQQQFARDGAEPAWSTPAQFGERIVREVARWRKIVAAAGLQVQ